MTYQWLHDRNVIENENSAVLNLTKLKRKDCGDYSCIATVNNVSANSNSAHLVCTDHEYFIVRDRKPEAFIDKINSFIKILFIIIALFFGVILIGMMQFCMYMTLTQI